MKKINMKFTKSMMIADATIENNRNNSLVLLQKQMDGFYLNIYAYPEFNIVQSDMAIAESLVQMDLIYPNGQSKTVPFEFLKAAFEQSKASFEDDFKQVI